jgi:CheY-like chemotaxis protein
MGIVRSLLQAHGGTIDIRSEPGTGSEFVVALPVAPMAVTPGPRQAVDGRRILVVDDEVDIAELLGEQLKRLGAQVELAHSGEEALERLRSGGFDAVTLDQKLPGMSGLQVLAAIRADPALAALPVVIVSAYLASSPGGEPVVTKPIDVGALARAVALAVTGGRPRALLAARGHVLDSLRPVLEDVGVAWDQTGSAEDAAATASTGRFDLVLLDAGLPRAELLLDVLREHGPDTLLVLDAPDGAALRGAVHVTLDGLPGVLRDTFFVGSLRPAPAGGRQPEEEG